MRDEEPVPALPPGMPAEIKASSPPPVQIELNPVIKGVREPVAAPVDFQASQDAALATIRAQAQVQAGTRARQQAMDDEAAIHALFKAMSR